MSIKRRDCQLRILIGDRLLEVFYGQLQSTVVSQLDVQLRARVCTRIPDRRYDVVHRQVMAQFWRKNK
jgi:hypothetical protein